jgi:hypothetical protein
MAETLSSSSSSSPSAAASYNGALRVLVLLTITCAVSYLLRRQLRQFFTRVSSVFLPFVDTSKTLLDTSTSGALPANILLVTNNRSGGGLGLAIAKISARLQNGPEVIPLELRGLSNALKKHLRLPSRSMRFFGEKGLSSSPVSTGGSEPLPGSIITDGPYQRPGSFFSTSPSVASGVHPSPPLRIVCAGGDGTISGIVHLLCELGVSAAVSLAVMPLGTGNDVARSLGLLGSPPAVTAESLSTFFERASTSPTRRVDVFSVSFSVHSEGSIHVLRNGVETVLPEREVRGSSLLYTSVGLDAELVWEVERRRQRHRYLNKLLYALVGASFIITRLRESWLTSSSSSGEEDGELEEIIIDGERVAAGNLPSRLVSILALSSPSYAGGTTMWPTTWTMNANIYERMRTSWNKRPANGSVIDLPPWIESILRIISSLPFLGIWLTAFIRLISNSLILSIRMFLYPWFLIEPWAQSRWDDGKFELIGAKSLLQISGAVGTKTGLFGGLLRLAQPSSIEAKFKRPPESLRNELEKVELGTPIAEPEMITEEHEDGVGDAEVSEEVFISGGNNKSSIPTTFTSSGSSGSSSSSSSSSTSALRKKEKGFATLHTLSISAPIESEGKIMVTSHSDERTALASELQPPLVVSAPPDAPITSPQRSKPGTLAYLSPSSHPAVGKVLGLRGRTAMTTHSTSGGGGNILPFSSIDLDEKNDKLSNKKMMPVVKPVFIQVDGEAYKVYGLYSLRIEVKQQYANLVVPTK